MVAEWLKARFNATTGSSPAKELGFRTENTLRLKYYLLIGQLLWLSR